MGNFLKLDCLRVDFKAIFKPISVILQAIFFSVIYMRLGFDICCMWSATFFRGSFSPFL